MFEKLQEEIFIVFDCETTGLNYKAGHQIIELAGQKIKNGKVIDEYHELINPTVPVEEGAYNVHGLSNLYLAENGEKAEKSLPKFTEFINGSILVGHNILTFDIPFLNAELARIGEDPVNNMVIDTLVMARKLLPNLSNHKLVTVAAHYDVDPSGAHRAMVDVEMNKQVFLKMLEQYLNHIKQEGLKKQAQNSGKLF